MHQGIKAHDLPLDADDWDRLIGIGRRRIYTKRDLICGEKEIAADYYVVLSGCVEIFKLVPGKDLATASSAEVRLALLDSGSSFGERCLFEESVRTATARAYQDTDLLVIDGVALRALLERDRDLAARFYRALCVKLSNILSDVEDDLQHLHRRLTFY